MYKLKLLCVRDQNKTLELETVAKNTTSALRRMYALLTDELDGVCIVDLDKDKIKIYDAKGLYYIGEVTKSEKANKRKKIQHSSSAKDRIRAVG